MLAVPVQLTKRFMKHLRTSVYSCSIDSAAFGSSAVPHLASEFLRGDLIFTRWGYPSPQYLVYQFVVERRRKTHICALVPKQ